MKCAIVTTSRADYSLLKSVILAVQANPTLTLQLIVSGTHLSPSHGATIREIERDGFSADWKVDLVVDSASKASRAHSMGLGLIGFATAFEHLTPDLVVVLGDRFEVFAAATAATVINIPIAHIAGGDVTEGAYDDAFRHGISKAASLHFPTNPDAARRLLQMGEPEERVHMVGSPGLDLLATMKWLAADEVFAQIGLKRGTRNVLVTYHPVTRLPETTRREARALVDALSRLPADVCVAITGTNIDTGAEEVRTELARLLQTRANVVHRESLGHTLYLNALRTFDVVVGNSSSGLYEAPSLETATVNIGDRQRGRPQATSVIDVAGDADLILDAMERAFALDCKGVVNPYGNGGAGARIAGVLGAVTHPASLLVKPFVDRSIS